MFDSIDNFLNRITMYRLVLYYLISLWAVAFIFSFYGILRYDPISMIYSAAVILAVGWLTNDIFARVFRAPANVESVWITGMILILIIAPALKTDLLGALPFLIWAPVLAMASKYILG